jgi:hypothetical protein
MQWFTREWASGGLSDSEWEERSEGYASHLKSIRGQLGDGTEALVADVNLNDAQVKSWSFEPDGSFLLDAVIGDLQVGYETVTLRYGCAVTVPDAERVDALELKEPHTELWYDEIDVTADGRYLHSILIHPAGELQISFEVLEVHRAAASSTDRR